MNDAWLEVSIAVAPDAVEHVAAVFDQYGQGVAMEYAVESSRDGDVVDMPAGAPVTVRTYLPLADPEVDDRRARVQEATSHLGRLQVRTLRETDWANAWKEFFFVHRVGEHTVIVPSWREAEYEPREGDVLLLLDPGMAFGTGLHPTTRLCLRAVEEVVRPGQRVIDIGAGSGILSIAAARLGAARVEAIEIESVATAVCLENVIRNGLSSIVKVHQGALEAAPTEPFDLLLANISMRALLDLRPMLAAAVRPGGTAVLSGVLAERVVELLDALRADGWQHVRTDQEQDWVAARLRRT
jgi:ribosomal protein L11 methyltransferase